MKKLILGTAIFSLFSCQNTVKETGTYKATFPCADCPGIETTLTLNDDNTYVLSDRYLERDDVSPSDEKGTFTIDENKIISLSSQNFPNKFKVSDNELIALDKEGNEIKVENTDYDLNHTGKVFIGTIPCKECDGIRVVLTLNDDKTYIVTEEFLNDVKNKREKRKRIGEYTLSETGALTLKNEKVGYKKVKMRDGKVYLLEDNEKVATGNTTEEDYILQEVGKSFYGVIPCADCEGIEVNLHINADQTFVLFEQYKKEGEKEIITTGKYTLDNNIITLNSKEVSFKKFRVYADKGSILDENGNNVMMLNEAYILKKQEENKK